MKSIRGLWASLLICGMMSLGSALWAQNDTSKSDVSSVDKHFAEEAAKGGLAEVEFGQLAQSKADHSEVKDFGEKMVNDHSKANDELKDCAAKLGLTLPDHLTAKDTAEKGKLKAYSGSHFDKTYMEMMVKDHRADIAAFEREARDGQNSELKRFASKTLPTLQEHLRMAEKTAKAVGATPGAAASGGASQ